MTRFILRVGYCISTIFLLESVSYIAVFGPVEMRPPNNEPFNWALLLINFALWKYFLGTVVSLFVHVHDEVGRRGFWKNVHLALTILAFTVYGLGFFFSSIMLTWLRVWGAGLSFDVMAAAFGPAVYLSYAVYSFFGLWQIITYLFWKNRSVKPDPVNEIAST